MAVFGEKAGVFKAALTAVIGMGFMPKARLFALIFKAFRILQAPSRFIQPLAFCLAFEPRTTPLLTLGPGVVCKKPPAA